MDIFEKASKLRLRFPSAKGQLTVEDLWALPLNSQTKVSLNGLAIEAYNETKDDVEISFVRTAAKTKTESIPQLRLDILKRIIEVREQELDVKTQDEARKARKDRLRQIIADKKDQALWDSDLADLEAELEKL